MSETEIHDSPSGWVAEHIRTYVETNGREGHHWNGVPTLLLTTQGRRTGRLRRTALIYGRIGGEGESGGDYVVVASQGGRPHHPAWYLNLVDHPEVHVQVGAEKLTLTARTATGEERARLWRQMAGILPDYDAYQARTSREIPVVVLVRGTG